MTVFRRRDECGERAVLQENGRESFPGGAPGLQIRRDAPSVSGGFDSRSLPPGEGISHRCLAPGKESPLKRGLSIFIWCPNIVIIPFGHFDQVEAMSSIEPV